MITADTIRRCAYLDSISLENLLQRGYSEDRVLRSEFLGITNGGQFAYKIVYPDQDGNMGMAVTKVFVWLDNNGDLIADY